MNISDTIRPRRSLDGLGIRGKILLSMIAVILITVASIVIFVNRTINQEVQQALRRKLNHALSAFESTEQVETQNTLQKARLLTQMSFIKALVTSKDHEAILQFSNNSLEKLNASLILVTDQTGQILARTDMQQFGQDLSSLPAVSKTLKGEEGSGLLFENETAFRILSFPVHIGTSITGTISLGSRIDDQAMKKTKELIDGEISFVAGGQVIASAWSGQERAAFIESVREAMGMIENAARNPAKIKPIDMRIAGEVYRTRLVPWRGSAGDIEGFHLIQTSKDQAASVFHKIQRMILIISAAAILVAAWLSFLVARQIARPIQDLTSNTLEIAKMKGDLTRETPVYSNDEVGQLATSFNIMIGSFRDLVIRFRDAAFRINYSASEISRGVNHQAAGASEQSSTVTEASTTVEELSQTAGRIAENAKNLSSSAEETLRSMRDTKVKVDEIAKKILTLGEKSQAIGSITKMIDDLAERSNLLALNAAIEAARAGEAGRGFAIVAGEVGKLAERSAESTNEIRQLINEIQHEMNSTIMGVEDTTKWTDNGLRMVGETTQVIKEISIATQQQKSAAEQVVEAMSNIDKVATSFASTTGETATNADELNELSARLRDSVRGFKVERNGSNTGKKS